MLYKKEPSLGQNFSGIILKSATFINENSISIFKHEWNAFEL